jgi:imidazoleglycerol phosphate dehydratase HisB
MTKRTARILRKTKETDIELALNLDGAAQYHVDTGIGFLDHMLELVAKHGGFDLKVSCKGDLRVDSHHSVEDVGLCLGEAILQALGDKRGIRRYGFFLLPMDEALAQAVVDLSGRPYFALKGKLPSTEINGFPPELAGDFFRAVSDSGKLNLHLELRYGRNSHHCLEALFKCFARALSMACGMHGKDKDIPSTKGVL